MLKRLMGSKEEVKIEPPEFCIKDEREYSGIEVYRGEKLLGSIMHREDKGWLFMTYAAYCTLSVDELERIAHKISDLNNE